MSTWSPFTRSRRPTGCPTWCASTCPACPCSSGRAVPRRVCDAPPPPVRAVTPETPEWLAEIIQRLHAKGPASRFQSADELADLLARHLAHLEGLPLLGPVTPDPAPPRAPAG